MKKLLLLATLFFAASAFGQAVPITVGKTVTLTAKVTAGTLPLSYAWKKNGVALPTTGSVLTIPNVQLSDAGPYTVTVSNSAGAATSPPVTMSINLVIPAGATITITAS